MASIWDKHDEQDAAQEEARRKAADLKFKKENEANFANLFNGSAPNFSIRGSNNENAGRIEGLQRARVLTGQNPYEIGSDYQEAYGNIKKRSELSDTGSELLRANKAGAVADVRNQLQQQGVKGGSAAGAVSQVERAKEFDINNMQQQNQQKAQNDFLNAVKSNANFTISNEMGFGALGAGKDIQAPPQYNNGFGTVICTELHRQGYFSNDIMTKDRIYGMNLRANRPHVYVGYISWAPYVVKGMQKSKPFAELVAMVAVPWAKNMAYDNNKFGKLVSIVGETFCGILGKIIITFSGEEYAN